MCAARVPDHTSRTSKSRAYTITVNLPRSDQEIRGGSEPTEDVSRDHPRTSSSGEGSSDMGHTGQHNISSQQTQLELAGEYRESGTYRYAVPATVPHGLYLRLKSIKEDTSACVQYLCGQLEDAPTTGQRHAQCYIYFKNPVRLPTIRALFHSRFGVHCHADVSRGTPEQNRDYCSKNESAVEDSFCEFGVCPSQGKRIDLAEIAAEVAAGTDMSDIAANFPSQFIRYHHGIQALATITKAKHRCKDNPVSVHWWFGPTGTGKSRTAFEKYPDAYIKMNCKWWDGYLGQSTVIMDDYRPSMCLFSELLRILDRYPHRVEAKGTSVPLSATCFVITTTSRPEVLWSGRTEEDVGQLLRRIGTVIEFKEDGSQTILKDENTMYERVHVERAIVDTFNPY